MARCGCGGSCGCSLVNGAGTTVTGTGSTALPYQVNVETDCDAVLGCLSQGQGIAISPAGEVSVCVSPDAGNALTTDANGCLTVPGGTVVTGCGLTGAGTAGSPLAASTSPWAFPGTAATNGSAISCDAEGRLRGEAPYHTYHFSSIQEQLYPANPAVPTGNDVIVHTFEFVVTNPDPARAMRVISFRDLDVDFDLATTARAAFGISTDEMWSYRNTGSAAVTDAHVQLGKMTAQSAALAPGASITLTLEAAMGKGTTGATYNRIQGSFRITLMPF